MKKNNSFKNILVVLGLIVVVSLGYWVYDKQKPGQLDIFAQCLGEKSAKFYGAFWCPHCQAQKALFGNSKDKLPYVECSTPDGQGQTEECKNKNITGYPTWEFAVGTSTEMSSGEKTLKELSEKTGCQLPTGF